MMFCPFPQCIAHHFNWILETYALLTIQVGSCVLSLVSMAPVIGAVLYEFMFGFVQTCLEHSKIHWYMIFSPIKVTIEFCCAPFFGPTSHGKTNAATDLVVDEFGAYTI